METKWKYVNSDAQEDIPRVQKLEDKVDNNFKKMNTMNEKSIDQLSEISKKLSTGLVLLKDNQQAFENIFKSMVETFQLQNKNTEQLSEMIHINQERFENQLKWVNKNIEDIKDYVNLPWYKKLFMKLF